MNPASPCIPSAGISGAGCQHCRAPSLLSFPLLSFPDCPSPTWLSEPAATSVSVPAFPAPDTSRLGKIPPFPPLPASGSCSLPAPEASWREEEKEKTAEQIPAGCSRHCRTHRCRCSVRNKGDPASVPARHSCSRWIQVQPPEPAADGGAWGCI